MTKTLGLAAVLVVSCFANSQGRPGDRPPGGGPPQLMRKVFAMRDKVRFVGVRIVQHIERGEKRVVTERIIRDGRNVRIEVVDGPLKGQISVENDQTRRVWSPRTNEIREMPARESEFMHRLGKIGGKQRGGERPTFVESEGGKIAGVSTRLLEMKSSDGKVLNQTWIDPAHGLVVKFQSLEGSGKRSGYLEFTSLRFPSSIPRGSFVIDKPGARVITLEDELKIAGRELGFNPVRLGSSGWRLVGVRKMDAGGNKILMQMYRNQQMQVSLFQTQGQVDPERLKHLQGGRMASHVWEQRGYKLVLIGNVPQEGLKRLASTASE